MHLENKANRKLPVLTTRHLISKTMGLFVLCCDDSAAHVLLKTAPATHRIHPGCSDPRSHREVPHQNSPNLKEFLHQI